MRRHPQILSDNGITPQRYQELQAICRQYPIYVRMLRRASAGIVDKPNRRTGAWKQPDPTGNQAASLADSMRFERERMAMIERCLKQSAPTYLYKPLLKSVTEGYTWEHLRPPCGKRQFYDARLWFFIALDEGLREG